MAVDDSTQPKYVFCEAYVFKGRSTMWHIREVGVNGTCFYTGGAETQTLCKLTSEMDIPCDVAEMVGKTPKGLCIMCVTKWQDRPILVPA